MQLCKEVLSLYFDSPLLALNESLSSNSSVCQRTDHLGIDLLNYQDLLDQVVNLGEYL